jgi:hypothetical protein
MSFDEVSFDEMRLHRVSLPRQHMNRNHTWKKMNKKGKNATVPKNGILPFLLLGHCSPDIEGQIIRQPIRAAVSERKKENDPNI